MNIQIPPASQSIKIIGIVLVLLLVPLFAFFLSQNQNSPTHVGKSFVAGQLVLRYASDYAPGAELSEKKKQKLADAFSSVGVASQEQIFPGNDPVLKNYYLLHLKPDMNVLHAQALLKKFSEIGSTQPNYLAKIAAVPNDPLYTQFQGEMKNINMEQTWDITEGSSQVTVAVIDTGIDYNHDDLPGGQIIKGKDYISCNLFTDTGACAPGKLKNCPKLALGYCDDDPMDDNGHGTHVAGVIGALSNNAKGMASIAPNVRLMGLKVLNADGSGPDTLIAKGMKDAIDAGAKLLNLSFTSDSPIPCQSQLVYKDITQYASQKGVLIIAASGNVNKLATFPPASCDGVLSVGAVNEQNARAPFSNFGDRVDIAAPGVNVLSAKSAICDNLHICTANNIVNNNYLLLKGTSMATPHVSGVAALLLSINPSLSSIQLKDCIKNNADLLVTDQPIGKKLNALKAMLTCKGSQAPTGVPIPNQSAIPVFFTNQGSLSRIASLAVAPLETVPLNLYIDVGQTDINGFQIQVATSGLFTIVNLTEGPGALKFNTKIFSDIIDAGHTLRFTKANSDPNVSITGLLHVGTVTFAAPAQTGSGSIDFPKVTISSFTNNEGLPFTAFPVSYTIATNSTPSQIPAETLTPTPSGIPCIGVNPTSVQSGQPIDVQLQECPSPTPPPSSTSPISPTPPPSKLPHLKIVLPGWMKPFIPPLPPFVPFIIEFDNSLPNPFTQLLDIL